jgi:hypothetical protein
MTFLVELPPAIGATVFALTSVAITATLFVIVHLLFRGRRTEVTRTIAQQMALRIGTMHALVVGVLTSQLINLHQISDTEAVSAARIYWTLKNNPAPEAVELSMLIPIYFQTVIEKDWKALSTSPQYLPAWELIARMQDIVAQWEPSTSTSTNRIIRNHVFNKINTMAQYFVSMAMPSASPLREQLNRRLAKILDQEAWIEVQERYIGNVQ